MHEPHGVAVVAQSLHISRRTLNFIFDALFQKASGIILITHAQRDLDTWHSY